MSSTFLYLIEAENGRVKIGCSSAPEKRVYSFCNGSCAVRLIAKWSGTLDDEAEMHQRFSAARVYREWFRLEGEFAEFVALMRGLGVERIREWDTFVFGNGADMHQARCAMKSEGVRRRWQDPEYRLKQARSRRGEWGPLPSPPHSAS